MVFQGFFFFKVIFRKHVFSRLTPIVVLMTQLKMRSLNCPSFCSVFLMWGNWVDPCCRCLQSPCQVSIDWSIKQRDSGEVRTHARWEEEEVENYRTRGYDSQILLCLFIHFSSFMWLNMLGPTQPCRLSTCTSLEGEFPVKLMESEEGFWRAA